MAALHLPMASRSALGGSSGPSGLSFTPSIADKGGEFLLHLPWSLDGMKRWTVASCCNKLVNRDKCNRDTLLGNEEGFYHGVDIRKGGAIFLPPHSAASSKW